MDSNPNERADMVMRAIDLVRRLNTFLHYVAGAGLVVMLVLTIADITGRGAFNNPVPGTVEVTALLLVVVVFLGLAHSEDRGDHITVDLIYERVPKRFQAVLDVFANGLSVVVLAVMAYRIYKFAIRQQESGAETPVLEWAIWPFVVIAALGCLGYAAATLLKLVLRWRGEPVDVADEYSMGSGVEI